MQQPIAYQVRFQGSFDDAVDVVIAALIRMKVLG